MLPWSKKGLYGIKLIFFLRRCNPTSFVSILSMITDPSFTSINLNKAYKIELFPAPVLPTIPIFIPVLTSKSKLFRAGGKSGLYFMNTLSNVI